MNHGAAQSLSSSHFPQSYSRNSAPTALTGQAPEIAGHLRQNTQLRAGAAFGSVAVTRAGDRSAHLDPLVHWQREHVGFDVVKRHRISDDLSGEGLRPRIASMHALAFTEKQISSLGKDLRPTPVEQWQSYYLSLSPGKWVDPKHKFEETGSLRPRCNRGIQILLPNRGNVREKTLPPGKRQIELSKARALKMARSAHAYVRGNTSKFYEWLDANQNLALPSGPSIWICGDCHVGNLGPVANADGDVEIQMRDFDQTVIGNPAHDLIRLGLSLSMAVRSSDLPGVTTALMIEQMMVGYRKAFHPDSEPNRNEARPESVHVALKEASRRTWRNLAEERLEGKTFQIPLGKRFWKVSSHERAEIGALFTQPALLNLATQLRRRPTDAPVELLDVAYWKKGCSSLGKLRYAAVLDVGGRASRGRDLCLIDIKEAVRAAAPLYGSTNMPHEYAQRVVEGARHLSPHLGERMAAARLGDRSVFVRELLPEDLKLEIESITPIEAQRAARYLARVVGRAHARQLTDQARFAWKVELLHSKSKSLDAPSWLWNSVVDLVGTHERGYLEHCRRFALETSQKMKSC